MINLFKKQEETNSSSMETLLEKEIPNHIAIIMDGNGRWAKKRKLPRVAGHKEGMNTVKKITIAANDLGVKVLTLYAFSTENWKRPKDEVNFLMQLPIDFFNTFVPELIENNIQVQVMGHIDKLPQQTQKAVNDAIEQTKHNTGMILNFALNYGGRDELVCAMQAIAKEVQAGHVLPEAIDENGIQSQLMTHSLVPYDEPELLIRTSGEERLSNFLLWQLAYSEFYFTEVSWPDFDKTALYEAIRQYQQRQRRFGGLNKGENE